MQALIDRLKEFYPEGRFDVRRFRPNIVVAPSSGEKDFVENKRVGRTLAIGDEVRLSITAPYYLPRDLGILRTVVQHNDGSAGVRASVLRAARSAAVIRSGSTSAKPIKSQTRGVVQGGCGWVAFLGHEMVRFATSCAPKCLNLLNLPYRD